MGKLIFMTSDEDTKAAKASADEAVERVSDVEEQMSALTSAFDVEVANG